MTSSRARAIAEPDQPVVRIGSPADICEAVPYFVGFEPAKCLVVIALRGARKRVGLTVRVDLPDSSDASAVTAMVLDYVERDGAQGVLVVAYAEGAEEPADAMARTVLDACTDRGIPVLEALRVAGGQWTSYSCRQACCPPEGTPLRDRLAAPGVVGTRLIAEGQQVLASRAALVESVAPVDGLLAAAMTARIEEELEGFLGGIGGRRASAYADETVRLAGEWVGRVGCGELLTVDAAARIIVGLLDRQVRDRCLGGTIGLAADGDPPFPAESIELWRQLVRRARLEGVAAPVATLLAASAYLEHGDGALANIALDVALDDDPRYSMAGYLRALLDGGIAPSMVRHWFDPDTGPTDG